MPDMHDDIDNPPVFRGGRGVRSHVLITLIFLTNYNVKVCSRVTRVMYIVVGIFFTSLSTAMSQGSSEYPPPAMATPTPDSIPTAIKADYLSP